MAGPVVAHAGGVLFGLGNLCKSHLPVDPRRSYKRCSLARVSLRKRDSRLKATRIMTGGQREWMMFCKMDVTDQGAGTRQKTQDAGASRAIESTVQKCLKIL